MVRVQRDGKRRSGGSSTVPCISISSGLIGNLKELREIGAVDLEQHRYGVDFVK